MFDPNAIMQQTSEAALDTSIPVVDPGEYQGVSTKVDVRSITFRQGDRAGQQGASLDVTFELEAPEFEAQYGRKASVRWSSLLDLTSEGNLDTGKGKNVNLGRLREAFGQNAAGQPWSPEMLKNQPAKVLVSHRMDGDNVYTDVKSVRSIHEE